MKKNVVLIMLILATGICKAQDSTQSQIDALKSEVASLKNGEKSHFMIRGFAQFGMNATTDNVDFHMTSFNPVLLWRLSDRLLFESELEMEYMDNEFGLSLGYANLSYVLAKGLVIKVGKILLPLGVFGEKLHPSWVNRFADMPIGLGHDNGMFPMSDIGIEIRGGLQLGRSKLSYSLYAVNGPRMKVEKSDSSQIGMLDFENSSDNNKNKAIGSRIAFLPLSNSSLEIGVSGYFAKPCSETSPYADDSLNSDITYKNVTATLMAVDFSYVKVISPIKGTIDIKAQYNTSDVSDATFLHHPDQLDTTTALKNANRYTFKNSNTSYYAQLSYRPSMSANNFLNRIELVGRYGIYNTPQNSPWHSELSQISVGLNYWLSWRTLIKIGYQITDGVPKDSNDMGGMGMSTGNMDMGTKTVSTFQIHVATGL